MRCGEQEMTGKDYQKIKNNMSAYKTDISKYLQFTQYFWFSRHGKE